jgi:hypothetical protein
VPEFTNTFHTLHTKLGIKNSKQHLVLKYRGALHRYIQTPSNPETTGWWSIFNPTNNQFVTVFHIPSNKTSPKKNATYQDSDLEHALPSSLGNQRNGEHYFLRGRINPGGYWWPPTCSNWLLLPVFSSTRSSVLLCNCGFYTSGAICSPTHLPGGYWWPPT